jgi:hypothetical protein
VALRSYDGAGILKISDTTELRAVDTVDFPLGDGRGKKAKFHMGRQVGPAIPY